MALGRSRSGRELEAIRRELGECGRCALGTTRGRVVFGKGPADARVMLIGEAPGRAEDLGGEPFIGAAGKLLDELLAVAGLDRDGIYIANVLKCRPPDNRDPGMDEVAACEPFLHRQIEAIDPEVLVLLGRFATRSVLHDARPMAELRGRLFSVDGRAVLPVFHPAAALYDRSKRGVLEADFVLLRELLSGIREAGS